MPLRLKSLELQGYKTFASKTTFEFAGGITAIVGPNGSGKSNIADSLRWVLGEQSYALLRGKKTEDMIFNGSEHRPRASMASAHILFDNTTNWLPVDFTGYIGCRDTVAGILASADVALAPGPHETFGLAALEALAWSLGVPPARVSYLPNAVEPERLPAERPGPGQTCDGLDQGNGTGAHDQRVVGHGFRPAVRGDDKHLSPGRVNSRRTGSETKLQPASTRSAYVRCANSRRSTTSPLIKYGMPQMLKLGYSSATINVTRQSGSSSRARRPALIPASLPPITTRSIDPPPGRTTPRAEQ